LAAQTAVVAPWGARLGYLRASLAAILAHRYARGEVFAARVAAVMGPDYDPNERLYIKVWREGCGKEDLMQRNRPTERQAATPSY